MHDGQVIKDMLTLEETLDLIQLAFSFADEETAPERWSNLPKILQQVSHRAS